MFTTNSQNTEMTQMPVNEQVHNTLHVQWVIVQSLKKKKKKRKTENLSHATIWLKLEGMPSEISQIQNFATCIFIF